MKKKSGLFVKINYKRNMKSSIEVAGKSAGNLSQGDLHRYMFCGGTYNKDGGTMIFRASDMDEAKYIVDNNPFVNMERYDYEILSRNSICL